MVNLPAGVLDLRPWKLTLPIGAAEKPTEVKQPDLARYQHVDYFTAVAGGVRFRAPVNGVTTSDSNNPRCELREMTGDGKSNASWSSSKGYHRMSLDMAFTRNPTGKPGVGVVGGQIHGASDDVCVFRLEGSKLWLTKGDTSHYKLITDTYQLGDRIQTEFRVWRDKVEAWFNGRLVDTIAGTFSGAFFKAGAYVQINAGASPMDSTNYGEVAIYNVTVEHTDSPVAGTPPASDAVGPIMAMRHAEKDDNADGEDDRAHALSDKGVERGKAIRAGRLFSDPRADLHRPTWVFASGPPPSRMVETAGYIVPDAGVPTIDSRYDTEKKVKETAALLVSQAKAGKKVLAVLEHSAIPGVLKEVGKLLGTTDKIPSSWSDSDFSTIYVFEGKRLRKTDEGVLPGDPGYNKPAPPPPVVVDPVPDPAPPLPTPDPVPPPITPEPPIVDPQPPDPAPTWPTSGPSLWDRIVAWFKHWFSV